MADAWKAAEHLTGDPGAPVTVVEYGDYECPYTRRAHRTVRDLLDRGAIRLVFRPFPLSHLHPRAQLAAEAAEAAAAQGRFWEMHEALMTSGGFDDDDLEAAAQEAGVDVERLATELRRRTHREAVAASHRQGLDMGVRTTPTFFVNDRRYDGPVDRANLEPVLTGEEMGGAART